MGQISTEKSQPTGSVLSGNQHMPVMVADGMHRSFLEKRFGMPLEAMPERGTAAIDAMLPS